MSDVSADWSLWRWLRESRRYMAHLPWWRFYPAAVRRWPAFNRQQKVDRREMEESAGRSDV